MRLLIRHCALWLIVLLLAAPLGQASNPSPREYRLCFYHTHTNERLDIVYRRGQNYLPDALAKLDHYLRDHRTGEVHHFDPHLFDLLYDRGRCLLGEPLSRRREALACSRRSPR